MRNNILNILFDIKPVDKTGRIDLQKITKVMPVVNLSNQKPAINAGNGGSRLRRNKTILDSRLSVADKRIGHNSVLRTGRDPASRDFQSHAPALDFSHKPSSWLARGNRTPEIHLSRMVSSQTGPRVLPAYQERLISQGALEKYLNSRINIKRELKAIGAKIEKSEGGKPRYKPILSNKQQVVGSKGGSPDYLLPTTNYETLDNYQTVLAKMNERITQINSGVSIGEPEKIDPISLGILAEARPVVVSPEIESWVRYATENPQTIGWLSKARSYLFKRNNFLAVGVIGFSALIFTSFGRYSVDVKQEVIQESSSAVAQLEQANENLKVFNFGAASNNFAQAYEEFEKAADSLNFMGASITSLFAELPGAGKLKSAKNLVEAGKLLAEAGKLMSEAVGSLSETGAIFDVTGRSGSSDIGDTIEDLKKSLVSSEKRLSKVNALLAEVDASILPEEKRNSFAEFQSKLPELEKIVSDGVGYTEFLESFIGSNGIKKYLILFQNNSELRPTGGFPGTYAVVTFEDGRLAGFTVDDVYNLDGQLKEDIIPPKQMQHITPTWGMRDANWFIDFSASAQKVMEFFNKEAGYEVDGVITMSPRMISEILKVVGPIEMPEYGFSLTDENFLSTIQAEVEYGENREQPKSVVMDMAPKLLERIYTSEPAQWLGIFNVFISGLDKKDILMYFRDLSLERFVAEKGFGGLIKNTDGDYLMVTLTNVKGSKTDKVIDNFIKASVRFEDDKMIHKLELTRQHNGGGTRYGFYNRRNPAFVRVLVPEGSELLSISDNSNPGYKSLINYSGDFKQDDNLSKLESSFNFDGKNKAYTYSESGKTGFAFWFIIDPGEKKTVELEYSTPVKQSGNIHNIYIQKQPGLEVDSLEFKVGDTSIYDSGFDKDIELRFKVE